MATKKEEKSFAEQFEELENITKQFEEQEDFDLDTSVKQFERGLEIAQALKKRLADVELKVKRIQEKFTNDDE